MAYRIRVGLEGEGRRAVTRPWADPEHPGNRIRPRVRCIGCGVRGCITAWGPWCFRCNVARMTRLNSGFAEIAELYGLREPHTQGDAP
jgi:hypothetical protein